MLRIVGLGLCMFLVACGGTQGPTAEADDMPTWVLNPPDACAVGIQKFRGNLNLAKSAAIASGRDELARQLNTKVEGMIKQYQSDGGTADGDFSEDQVSQVSRQ